MFFLKPHILFKRKTMLCIGVQSRKGIVKIRQFGVLTDCPFEIV